MRGDDIAERMVNFSVEILRFVRSIPKTSNGKHMESQLFRAATSCGANYEEARGAESIADFIHKLSVASKEIREAHYWIKVILRSESGNIEQAKRICAEADELGAILTSSIKTAKKRKSRIGTGEMNRD
ncbi:MAG: four helix bundle protein [Deltaproteobacteria bacterium]|nr:four helix bundle protein [Deltaproteobacteria bacterium]